MISKIKEQIECLKDEEIRFRYNGSRNQIEEFNGKIIACYKFIFIVQLGDIRRSFSYSDVLIGGLEVNI